MLKCTLRSRKTINGGIGEKKLFGKKFHFSEIFFHQILYHLGPKWKQEEDGCHQLHPE